MFEQLGSIHPLLPPFVGVLALLASAVIINLIAKRIVVGTVRAFARRSSVTWDDALVTHNVFGRLVQVVPALIVLVGVPFVPGLPEGVVQLMRNVAMGYMVLMLTLALTAMLSAANTIYSEVGESWNAVKELRKLDPDYTLDPLLLELFPAEKK